MKTALLVLASVGISVGATYVVVSNKKSAELNSQLAAKQAEWDAEKDRLERDLKRARGQAPRIETVNNTVEVAVDNRQSPEQIIQRLSQIQPGTGEDRAAQQREIIFLLESLRERGQESVPAISGFLAKNQDVDYEPARTDNGDSGRGGSGGDQGGFRNRGPGGDQGGFRNRSGGGGPGGGFRTRGGGQEGGTGGQPQGNN